MVDRAIVRHAEPAVAAGGRIECRAHLGDRRVAALHQDVPGKARRGVIAVRRRHLYDMAEPVAGARIGGVDLVGLAARIVGEDHIDLVVLEIGLDVFGPVHPGRAEQVGGAPRLDHDVRLAAESVRRGQRSLAMDERQPVEAPVGVITGDVERALVEQVPVGGAIDGVVGARAHEPVDIVEPLVVARIDHDAAVFVDKDERALVLGAPERGAFLWSRGRIERIDFHDPAEPVRFVRLLGDVETVVELAPGVPVAGQAVSLEVLRFRVVIGELARKIAVEILLAGEPGSPRGDAAGAVVDGAKHAAPGRIGLGLHARVAGGRACELHRRRRVEPARIARSLRHAPLAVLALDLEHRAAMRSHFDVD